MRSDEPDALDRVLDEALARYSSVEPLAGLEQRVLDRIRNGSAAPRFRFNRWLLAAGLAALAGMLTLAILWNRPAPLPRQAVFAKVRPQPVRGFEPALRPARQVRRYARRRVSRPAPLSPEERALLALVARAPDQARAALLDLARRSTEPIQVERIKIEPLRIDDEKQDTK